MKSKPICILALGALLLAGCVGTSATPPDYGPVVNSQTYDSEVAHGGRVAYNVTLSRPGGIEYDLFVRDGKMELTIMPDSERDHFLKGEGVRTLSKNRGSSPQGMDGFNAGQYIVGLKCINWVDKCPYDLVIKEHAKEKAS